MSFLISKHLMMKRTIIPYAIALLTLITGIASTIIWMRTDWFDRYLQEFIVQEEAKDDPSDPEHYANITDVVKMFIAKYQLIAEMPDEKDQIDKKTKKMIKKWENSSRTYGELLQKDNNSEISKELLKKYNSFTPNFSEFHKKEEKVWTFTEKNTGVNFEVSIIAGVLSIETVNIGEYQERLKEQTNTQQWLQYLQEMGEGTLSAYLQNLEELNLDKNTTIKHATIIEDYVRYTLAGEHPALDDISVSFIFRVSDIINENRDSENDPIPEYKIALDKLYQEGNDDEKKWAAIYLQIYKMLNIDLTPLIQSKSSVSSKTYYFKEKNSGVRFSYNTYWEEVEENESDLAEYYRHLSTTSRTPDNHKPNNEGVIRYFEEAVGTKDSITRSDISMLIGKFGNIFPYAYEESWAPEANYPNYMLVPTTGIRVSFLMHHYDMPENIAQITAQYYDITDVEASHINYTEANEVYHIIIAAQNAGNLAYITEFYNNIFGQRGWGMLNTSTDVAAIYETVLRTTTRQDCYGFDLYPITTIVEMRVFLETLIQRNANYKKYKEDIIKQFYEDASCCSKCCDENQCKLPDDIAYMEQYLDNIYSHRGKL